MGQEDTISAIATAVGEGGIGIIRLSGGEALTVAGRLFKSYRGKMIVGLATGRSVYGHIIDPATGEIIDEVLLLIMRGPYSYTREDVVEIQGHGGIVPLRKILALTLAYGARLAEPGEFTKRAFLNGRLDLSQAEAVIDIIRAKTETALKVAVNQLSGRLADKIKELRTAILTIIAGLEAAIDFPDEDIEEVAPAAVEKILAAVTADIDQLLATAQTGIILRDGLETVIIGKPNVGKSSLLNALLRQQRAIVTEIPGTTRDVIEEYVNIRGIPLKIADTAGIRSTGDVIEKMGIERTREFTAKAGLILGLLDASAALTPEDYEVLTLLTNRPAIVLLNKSDLPVIIDKEKVRPYAPANKIISLSVKNGQGLAALEQAIVDLVYQGKVAGPEAGLVSNIRQTELLRQVKVNLQEARTAVRTGRPPECLAIDLRAAWGKLGEITGDTIDDDIIDQIFSQFCIGK